MSTEREADPGAQLAHSREAIAQWIKAQNTPRITPISPHVLLGLLLLAIAESVLKRSAKLPMSSSKLPSMHDAAELVKTSTRKHPTWMLGLAVVAGAALAASRPWRWLTLKKTWFGLLSQLVVAGMTQAFNHKSTSDTSP